MEIALIASLVILVVLSAVDTLSTMRILARGGAELNPVVGFSMRAFGKYWFVIKVALVAIAVAAAWWFPSWELVWALCFGNVATGWAVWNNIGVIRRNHWE